MSVSRNRHQANVWLQTAIEDMTAARALREVGSHALSCFLAQQVAEKAVKALWHVTDQEPWGHSVIQLLEEFTLRESLDLKTWFECARSLDQLYIPTRYPDSLPGITPGQAYGPTDSERALACAELILNGCREWLAEN